MQFEENIKKGILIGTVVLFALAIISILLKPNKTEESDTSKTTRTIITTTKINNQSDYMSLELPEIYDELLEGNSKIHTSNGNYTLDEYLSGNDSYLTSEENYSSYDYNLIKYAVIDLDGDYIEEIVFYLDYEENSAWAVLHYENNTVYGYKYIDRKEITNITSRGIIESLNNNNEVTYYQINFNKKSYSIQKLATSYLNTKDEIKYTIGNTKVTEAEFKAYEITIGNNITFIGYTTGE